MVPALASVQGNVYRTRFYGLRRAERRRRGSTRRKDQVCGGQMNGPLRTDRPPARTDRARRPPARPASSPAGRPGSPGPPAESARIAGGSSRAVAAASVCLCRRRSICITTPNGPKRTRKSRISRVERPMSEATDLPGLIRRARPGEETASTELARRFRPFIQSLVCFRCVSGAGHRPRASQGSAR
jgi:hypothetical protein